MSRYRKIHVKLWSSGDFLSLSKPKPNAQSLFLHLLTGEHTTAIPGVICAGKAALAEAIGWSLTDWSRCFSELESRGMAVADWEARLVYLPAALSHNEPANPNTVRSWRNEWQMVRACPLRDRIVAEMSATFSGMKKPEFAQAFADVLANVPGNVPGNGRRNVASEQPHERSSERSQEQSTERPPCVRAHAPSAPAPVTVLSVLGVQGGEPPAPAALPTSPVAVEILATAERLSLPVDADFANALALIAERAGKGGLVASALEDAAGALAAREGVTTTGQARDLIQRFVRHARPVAGVSGTGGGSGTYGAQKGRHGAPEPYNPFGPPTDDELRAAGVIQ